MDEEIREQDEQTEQEDKKEIGDILFAGKRKLDNFWYHHKLLFIIGVLALVFIIFGIVQCATKVKNDVDIAYIGPKEIGAAEYEQFQEALNEILGEDLNGDGKIQVGFTRFLYMTGVQAEIAAAKGQAVDYQGLMAVQTQISLELTGGNLILYFIDPEVYKSLSESYLFMDLEDVLGYIPENKNDDCSVTLGSLPCWEYYDDGIGIFPEDTILTARYISASEENDKDIAERYERSRILFKRLVEFTFDEEEPGE